MLRETGPIQALGAMSGTSMDGVDGALITTDGLTIEGFGEGGYRAYTAAERSVLRRGLGKWPDAPEVPAVAEVVETAHAVLLSGFDEGDLIGFHGQTLIHDPQNRRTHQAGSPQILAEILQRPVVGDFRTADVTLGGQGAPLAPFFHFAVAKQIGFGGPVAMLNLGGVGNLTWIDCRAEVAEEPGALLAFDTGPANGPIDDLVLARTRQPFDKNGDLAASGTESGDILDRFMTDEYFWRLPPKSLDRDHFAWLIGATSRLSDADAAATLTAASAAGVVQALEHCPEAPERILVAGGGRRNQTLLRMIKDCVPCPVEPVEAYGLDGDLFEAQAFGYLAVRVARGLPTSAPGTTGVPLAVGGGSVFWPGGVDRASA